MKNAIIILAAACIATLCGCSKKVAEDKGQIEALNKQIEMQSKRLEEQQTQIEALRDSIGILQQHFERIRTHSTHAQVDVKQARSWASANGYGSTLVPSIDNVLYDLEAISEYSNP